MAGRAMPPGGGFGDVGEVRNKGSADEDTPDSGSYELSISIGNRKRHDCTTCEFNLVVWKSVFPYDLINVNHQVHVLQANRIDKPIECHLLPRPYRPLLLSHRQRKDERLRLEDSLAT